MLGILIGALLAAASSIYLIKKQNEANLRLETDLFLKQKEIDDLRKAKSSLFLLNATVNELYPLSNRLVNLRKRLENEKNALKQRKMSYEKRIHELDRLDILEKEKIVLEEKMTGIANKGLDAIFEINLTIVRFKLPDEHKTSLDIIRSISDHLFNVYQEPKLENQDDDLKSNDFLLSYDQYIDLLRAIKNLTENISLYEISKIEEMRNDERG